MDDAAPAPGLQSVGTYLSAQRRLRGISVEELSAQTRIPLRSLERLEAGAFDADVDGFVRGFVRTVAEALGLDPEETLNRTLEEPGSRSGPGAPRHLSLRRVLVTLVAVLSLGAVGFGVQLIAISLSREASPGSSPGITLRRDPIRSLAEAQGVAALAPAPALSLAAAQEEAEASTEISSVSADESAVAPPAVP